MHYMTGREDLDAPRFCHLQFNPPEGHRTTITIALSFTCIVEPSILPCKFIVVNEKAILSARMAKIRTFTRILEIVAEESGFSSATM